MFQSYTVTFNEPTLTSLAYVCYLLAFLFYCGYLMTRSELAVLMPRSRLALAGAVGGVAGVLMVLTFVALLGLGPFSWPRIRFPKRRTDLDIAVKGDEMSPKEITVRADDHLTLRITTDHDIAFHVPGYDLIQEVGPGSVVTLSFEATITGRFEIEDEKVGDVLGTLIVEPR
jgi:hypothetical protein